MQRATTDKAHILKYTELISIICQFTSRVTISGKILDEQLTSTRKQ